MAVDLPGRWSHGKDSGFVEFLHNVAMFGVANKNSKHDESKKSF